MEGEDRPINLVRPLVTAIKDDERPHLLRAIVQRDPSGQHVSDVVPRSTIRGARELLQNLEAPVVAHDETGIACYSTIHKLVIVLVFH